MLKQRKV